MVVFCFWPIITKRDLTLYYFPIPLWSNLFCCPQEVYKQNRFIKFPFFFLSFFLGMLSLNFCYFLFISLYWSVQTWCYYQLLLDPIGRLSTWNFLCCGSMHIMCIIVLYHMHFGHFFSINLYYFYDLQWFYLFFAWRFWSIEYVQQYFFAVSGG